MWENAFHFSPVARELQKDVGAPKEIQSPASLECHVAEQLNWSEELCPISIWKGRLDKQVKAAFLFFLTHFSWNKLNTTR